MAGYYNGAHPANQNPMPAPIHTSQNHAPSHATSYDHYSYADDYATGNGYDDDTKSYQSHHSTTHLSPHEASHYPPMPAMPYAHGRSPVSPLRSPGSSYDAPYSPTRVSEAKQKLLKRRSVRNVELQQGNLVLDCPVPQSILQHAKNYASGAAVGDQGEEFTKMRYTAVTCDPDDFNQQKYTLRPYLLGRRTELAICLTMYNEDEVLFCRTFTSVVKNLQHLATRTKSKTWGPDSWQKVVVVVVSDGRAKIDSRTLKVLGLMGVYQDGIAKDTMAGKDVSAHVFEYSTQVVVNDMGEVKGGILPVQVLFCLKEQNQKKLNSHRWFYNAFCAQLQPNVTVLLDVGTKPSATSIYLLHKAFARHKGLGGACGEITCDTGRGCANLVNPLVASQNFEYKMSNILDKPLESMFGYITVLPGAFSAYRYKALLGAPLAAYFKGEAMHADQSGALAFASNMYLAEDRILCYEIVTKRREAWTLKYVKSAKASTDVPDRVSEFISQRRRWLNGSFFASLYATAHFFRIWTSGQGFFRKLWLTIEWAYQLVSLIFSITSIANFYLSFFFLVQSATSDPTHDPFGGYGSDVLQVLTSVYISILFVILVCSLGNRPQGAKFAYTLVIFVLACIMGIALYCAAWTVWLAVPHTAAEWRNVDSLLKQDSFRDIVISLGATYGLYFISSVIHLEPWHMFTSFAQYLFLMPAYINVLQLYSICNLHDVSWGTKGQSGPSKDLGSAKKGKGQTVEVEVPTIREDIDAFWLHMKKDMAIKPPTQKEKRSAAQKSTDHFANFRTNVVLSYLGCNMLIIVVFTSTAWLNWVAQRSTSGPTVNYYIVGIFWSVAGLSLFRFVGTVLYLLLRLVGH